ncbi:hypothetical protein Tco_1215790 [Tanacetum coccineum]
MAISNEQMRIFHGMDDAKEIWEAIRTRFGGNANSKKMQKAVFKQQFEAFTISSSEGLEKGYDRFQQLLSQLEAHGAEVSNEDANYKFLRSLPPAWSNLAMTMRTKPDVDTLSIDDLYNNLRVFEQEIQVLALLPLLQPIFLKKKFLLVLLMKLFILSLPIQSEDWDLLHEDLEQIDDLDIEEMDINWQIAMIAIRMKKFYKKTGRRQRGHVMERGERESSFLVNTKEAGKQEKNRMGLADNWMMVLSNCREHTEKKRQKHALMLCVP